MSKEINMYRTHQEGAGVNARLTAEEELLEMGEWNTWGGGEKKDGYPFHANTPVEVKVNRWLGFDRISVERGLAKEFNWAYGPAPDGVVVAYKVLTSAELCEKYLETAPTQGTKEQPPSKYHVKNIWKDEEWVDFYMMYDQCRIGKPHQIGDSAIEHAWKKITQAGERSGGKSKVHDIKEAIWSLQKALEMIEKAGARIEEA